MTDALAPIAVLIVFGLLWPTITSIVEEWSYENKQTDSHADSDSVASGVVRRRKRRISLSPWVK